MEQDLDAFTSRQNGGDAGVRVSDVDLCLWGETWSCCQSRGLLWTVDHCGEWMGGRIRKGLGYSAQGETRSDWQFAGDSEKGLLLEDGTAFDMREKQRMMEG